MTAVRVWEVDPAAGGAGRWNRPGQGDRSRGPGAEAVGGQPQGGVAGAVPAAPGRAVVVRACQSNGPQQSHDGAALKPLELGGLVAGRAPAAAPVVAFFRDRRPAAWISSAPIPSTKSWPTNSVAPKVVSSVAAASVSANWRRSPAAASRRAARMRSASAVWSAVRTGRAGDGPRQRLLPGGFRSSAHPDLADAKNHQLPRRSPDSPHHAIFRLPPSSPRQYNLFTRPPRTQPRPPSAPGSPPCPPLPRRCCARFS